MYRTYHLAIISHLIACVLPLFFVEPEYKFKVERTNFFPQPKVTSYDLCVTHCLAFEKGDVFGSVNITFSLIADFIFRLMVLL